MRAPAAREVYRILVTGSEGTLGTRLVAKLRTQGHSVFTCDLMHTAGPSHMRADVANYRQLAKVFTAYAPQYVYHLAAEFGRNNGEAFYEQVWTTNCVGTRNVLELCNMWGSKMIFASSSEVYGEEPFNEVLDSGGLPIFGDGKSDRLREVFLDDQVPMLTNEYAISKYTNELQIRNFVKRYDLPVCVLRFFNAYGPGERYHPYRSVVCLFVHSALTGKPWDVYEGYHRTFMHVDDFIPTLTNVLRANVFPRDVYNVGGRDYRSVEDLSRIVLKHTGADPKLARFLGQEKHNVVNKRPDISKAERDLDHDPQIKLEEGVPNYVEWMRGQLGRSS